MYTLLHGAKKNVGDFLIYERARSLVERELDGPFHTFLRDRPLDEHLDVVNQSRAVLLLGGPGYHANFHPKTFRFTTPLSRLTVPIIPIGLGWGGKPMDAPESFRFSEPSLEALRFISERAEGLGCRDVLTVEVLRRAGLEKAVLTGCPAWYDAASLGQPFSPPSEIRRVVFTPPQNTALRSQAVPVMKVLRDLFPSAERYCVFHRGWEFDRYTRQWRDVAWNQWLRLQALRLGFRPVNAAYETDRIEMYRECDLHVGYRVHAQIFFLSIRKPSVLIHEDGRGVGLSRTFGLPDISAFADDVAGEVRRRLQAELDSGFERFHRTAGFIDETHASMRRLVRSVEQAGSIR